MVDLEFISATKRWPDGSLALRDVSFTVAARRLTTVLGPSGCGKSTLLRVAAGLEALESGRVLVGGVDVADIRREQACVSLMFQNGSLFPHLNVEGNVGFGLRMRGLSPRVVRGRVAEMLQMVGLSGVATRTTAELSGGEQQRVALARALALEPSVVLLDEPLSNLDPSLRRQLRDEIRSLQQRLGVTMACVTHDESEALAFSDVIVVMERGMVVQVGTPREVYERPNSEFVARFMGEAALFDAIADEDGATWLGPFRVRAASSRPGEKLRVMVRPHAWQLRAVGTEGLPGRVLRRTYLGRLVEYWVDTDLGELLVSSDRVNAMHQPGSPVTLTLGDRGVGVLRAAASEPLREEAARPPAPANCQAPQAVLA